MEVSSRKIRKRGEKVDTGNIDSFSENFPREGKL